MRRLRLTLLLLMLLMLLTACAPSGNSMEALSVTAAPQEDEIPRADGDDAAATDTSALIWYRYGDEPMLAAERRTVSRLPNEPYETALLRLLLDGPSLNAPRAARIVPGGYARDFDLPAGRNALRHPVVSADERLFGRAEQLAVGHGVGAGSTAPPEAGDAGDCRDGDGKHDCPAGRHSLGAARRNDGFHAAAAKILYAERGGRCAR